MTEETRANAALERLETAVFEASRESTKLRTALIALVEHETAHTRGKLAFKNATERDSDYCRGYLAATLKLKIRLTEDTKKWPTLQK